MQHVGRRDHGGENLAGWEPPLVFVWGDFNHCVVLEAIKDVGDFNSVTSGPTSQYGPIPWTSSTKTKVQCC